jgi:hypothetical protein
MTRLWKPLAIVLILTAMVGLFYWQRSAVSAEGTAKDGLSSDIAPGRDSPQSSPARANAGAAASKRQEKGAASESRLRSMLNLKKSEMAYLEITREAMEKASGYLSNPGASGEQLGVVVTKALTAEIKNQLGQMVRYGMPLTGNVDTSAVGAGQKEFSWQGDGWKINGVYMLCSENDSVLQLHLQSGDSDLVTTVNVPDNGAVILRLPGGQRGIMIAVGKGGEIPVGE